jgi:Xaa-Pro aminopeptidase
MTTLQEIEEAATMKPGSQATRPVRLQALQHALAGAGSDLLVLAVTDNMRYVLSGFAPHADERYCTLLVTRTDQLFIVPVLNADQVRAHTEAAIRTYRDEDGPSTVLSQTLGTLGLPDRPRVAVDEEMRADHLLALQTALPGASYGPAGSIVGLLRSVKDADEIAVLREAAATADAGIQAVLAACKPGVTELELVAIASAAMARAGAEETVFATVGAGPHSALPHHQSDGTRIRPGDVVVVDIGSRLRGYCSDITRMVLAGATPPDAEYAQVHAVVEEASRSAQAAARPGVRASDVDAAARKVIADAGYGDYFIHRTGHGLGLSIHEQPYISASSEVRLEPGMVFSIEPGIYLPGRFGVRLEEIVYLDAGGAHVLSRLPRAVHVS